ncbi:c2h2 type zinc finger domain-containing protein [Colletotrichum incanum]|uniref:C2h2 type zinc finger domain-containing protein n=1 Tax=Colletotrichum incanum TaxID=1573173 RepID=A0A162PJ01_COLIC|nr:c2h2 type zinc finger domain-containing protein [Colletotrichum incanum]
MSRPFADVPKASGNFFAEDNARFAAANKEHEETTIDIHHALTVSGHGSEDDSCQLLLPLSLLAGSEGTDLSLVDDDWALPLGYLDDVDLSNELHTATQPNGFVEVSLQRYVPPLCLAFLSTNSQRKAKDHALAGKSDPSDDTGFHTNEPATHSANAGMTANSGDEGSNLGRDVMLPETNEMPPKIGRRFSRESARILKQWLSNHEDYPYPSHADKQSLQLLTGLTMTQISNWLANARRRQKAIINRRLSSSDQSPSTVSGRPGTPMPRRKTRDSPSGMNPIQRWVDSPPEDEPAAVGDIARALSSRRTLAQGGSRSDYYLDHSSGPSSVIGESSASSAGSSRDGPLSGASASSQSSGRSRGTSSPLPIPRQRRRRRKLGQRTPLLQTRGLYQCTFCTETFRTKYDWQRHEKSLHIPLERWTCSPSGPTSVNPETEKICCVFCGQVEPLLDHIARHNFDACQDRVFNRRDHLKQHLRLFHDADGVDWVIEAWKASSPEVKSRCGFCGKSLESFSERADHLSDHFKTGRTMADWTGDWGFEQWVLDSLENYISPYIIEFERSCPFPFEASHRSPSSPRTAYELITLELAFFVQEHLDRTGQIPTNKELQLEACRIVFASEVLSPTSHSPELKAVSWLRDLVTSDPEITQQAKFSPIRSQSESRLSSLQIIGKSTLFDSCPLELQLRGHLYRLWSSSSAAAIDSALQIEACRMVTEMEKSLSSDGFSDIVANWLTKLIIASADWLASFKERARLQWEPNKTQRSNQDSQQMIGDLVDVAKLSKPQYDMILQSNTSLTFPQERPLDTNLEPLAWQAQGLVNPSLLSLDFSSSGQENDETPELIAPFTATSASSSAAAHMTKTAHKFSAPQEWSSSNNQAAWLRSGQFILNNSSSHRWLSSDLKRWVAATMSPSNPDCHVPSDDEIRLQARYLLFGDGDPWNPTEADNAQWLAVFKKEAGIEKDSNT